MSYVSRSCVRVCIDFRSAQSLSDRNWRLPSSGRAASQLPSYFTLECITSETFFGRVDRHGHPRISLVPLLSEPSIFSMRSGICFIRTLQMIVLRDINNFSNIIFVYGKIILNYFMNFFKIAHWEREKEERKKVIKHYVWKHFQVNLFSIYCVCILAHSMYMLTSWLLTLCWHFVF